MDLSTDASFPSRATLAASSKLGTGARAWGAMKYWPEQSDNSSDDWLMAYGGISQRLWDGLFHAQIVYGITGNQRTDGFDIRHFGALQMSSKF